MPFKSPYRQYNRGDMLYGLAGPRAELAAAMFIRNGEIHTIDQFDTFADARPNGTPLNGLTYDAGFNAAVAQATDDASRHVDLNSQQQWQANPAGTGAVARRKCKTGIDYVCRYTQAHIHFCLKGFDLVAAAGKSYNGAGASDNPVGKAHDRAWHQKTRSITGAEIRWVYRNRHDPSVANRVQFWDQVGGGWNACPPPWDDDRRSAEIRAAFRNYHPSVDRMELD